MSRYRRPQRNDITNNGRGTTEQKAETRYGKYLPRDRNVVQMDNPWVNAQHQGAVPESGKACRVRPLDLALIAANL